MLFVTRIHLWKRVFFVAATAAGLAVAGPPGYWQQMRTMFSPTQDYNWLAPGGRRQIWLRGVGYMLAYPVFGVGIGNFGRAEATISERAKNWRPGYPGIRWSAPHNSFLEAGAELGVPGLVLWSSLVLGGTVAMLRQRRRLPEWWARGDREQRFLYLAATYLPVSLTGFAASSFFVSFAFLDPVYILAAFMSGIYVCTGRKLAEAQRKSGSVS
jgi:O-antigen ligase